MRYAAMIGPTPNTSVTVVDDAATALVTLVLERNSHHADLRTAPTAFGTSQTSPAGAGDWSADRAPRTFTRPPRRERVTARTRASSSFRRCVAVAKAWLTQHDVTAGIARWGPTAAYHGGIRVDALQHCSRSRRSSSSSIGTSAASINTTGMGSRTASRMTPCASTPTGSTRAPSRDPLTSDASATGVWALHNTVIDPDQDTY